MNGGGINNTNITGGTISSAYLANCAFDPDTVSKIGKVASNEVSKLELELEVEKLGAFLRVKVMLINKETGAKISSVEEEIDIDD